MRIVFALATLLVLALAPRGFGLDLGPVHIRGTDVKVGSEINYDVTVDKTLPLLGEVAIFVFTEAVEFDGHDCVEVWRDPMRDRVGCDCGSPCSPGRVALQNARSSDGASEERTNGPALV